MNKTYNCIKCGGTNTMVGMVAENSAKPSERVKMIRCVCSKCGFTEFRMDEKDIAKVLGSSESKEKKD